MPTPAVTVNTHDGRCLGQRAVGEVARFSSSADISAGDFLCYTNATEIDGLVIKSVTNSEVVVDITVWRGNPDATADRYYGAPAPFSGASGGCAN